MRILLISDIHGNYPALKAVADYFEEPFDLVINSGDTTVYAPFPNETINWLRDRRAVSILGNTDRHVLTLLRGHTFKKPRKAEKRIMYGWTAAELSESNRRWLAKQPLFRTTGTGLQSGPDAAEYIGIYHGSPADPDEFLFATTPRCRFRELAAAVPHRIVTIGHSHSPFHRRIDNVHFINPGSVGRMFDGKPTAACAVLEVGGKDLSVTLHRIAYPVEQVVAELERLKLPPVYAQMYRQGRKLN